MAMNDYVPISWNGEVITTDKLNQMCNNTQYLFDRAPRARILLNGVPRDTQVKIIAGKTPYPPNAPLDYVNVQIYFGNFFSAGCRPVVTCTTEIVEPAWRKLVSIRGLSGGEIDNIGFQAQVHDHEQGVGTPLFAGGWIHWTAVGY